VVVFLLDENWDLGTISHLVPRTSLCYSPVVSGASLIKIGTAGWSYKDWDGIVYPGSLKKDKHPVEYLAQFFDLIEINSSFYGHIKPEIGLLWTRKARAVNRNFVFTAKLNKAFTHSPVAVIEPTSAATIRPHEDDEGLAKAGLDAIAGEGMLGALLAQFPISFKNTNENREYLEKVIEKFGVYPLVVEVRHSSWNNEGSLRYFVKKNVTFCNIDQPMLGRAIGPTEYVTSPLAYVRLHGRNYDKWFDCDSRDDRYNYLYTEQELRGWKSHIDNIAKRAKVTFVVTNNHFEGKAAVNALQLRHMISDQPVKVPPQLLKNYPDLVQIAEATNDGLF
jgi:uncharacterized protein YecE (DUF72 family)